VTAADIADLETRGLQAFSELIKKPIGEWFVVVGPSSARRANSVYPIGNPGRAWDSALEVAGEFLRSHGKPVLVKVAAAPGESHDLEPLLVSSAFCPEAPTEVLTMPLSRRDPQLSDKVFIEEALPGAGGPAARAIASIPGGVGRGRAVVMDEWIGIFDLETESGVQRKGLGRTILGSLLAWGAGLGAERAFLQVEAANVPARALYESAGFGLAYTYAYWRESPFWNWV
jgi:GNAT superfamily N-acetyltransferase